MFDRSINATLGNSVDSALLGSTVIDLIDFVDSSLSWATSLSLATRVAAVLALLLLMPFYRELTEKYIGLLW